MSQLSNLKNDIPHWNLQHDKKLLEFIRTTTEQTYKGIKGVIDSLEELEQNADDCLIHLKHAVNWIAALSYSKFIENSIQTITEEKEMQIKKIEVKVAKTHEEVLEKHRKAIQIAIDDLGIKDLQVDNVSESESFDGRTVAIGSNYITPQLKGRLPYFIGSKEFHKDSFIGLYKAHDQELSEENLGKLVEKENSIEDKEVEEIPQSNSVAVPVVNDDVKEKVPARETVAIPSVHLDSSFAYKQVENNPFALPDHENDEDVILPQYKNCDGEEKVEEKVKNPFEAEPIAKKTVAFVNEEKDEFAELYESRITVAQVPKPNYMQKLNKLFDFDEDEKEEKPKDNPQDLIKMYAKKESAKKTDIESSSKKLFESPLFTGYEASITITEKQILETTSENKESLINTNLTGEKTSLFRETRQLPNSSKKLFTEDISSKPNLFNEPLTNNSSTSTQEGKGNAVQQEVREETYNKEVFVSTSKSLFSDFNEDDNREKGKQNVLGGKMLYSQSEEVSISLEDNSVQKNTLLLKDSGQFPLFGDVINKSQPIKESSHKQSLFGGLVKTDTLFTESIKGEDSLFGKTTKGNLFDTEMKGSLSGKALNPNLPLFAEPTNSLFGKKEVENSNKKGSLFINNSTKKQTEPLFKELANKAQVIFPEKKETINKQKIEERLAKFLEDDDD